MFCPNNFSTIIHAYCWFFSSKLKQREDKRKEKMRIENQIIIINLKKKKKSTLITIVPSS